jgi:hypothetical protein
MVFLKRRENQKGNGQFFAIEMLWKWTAFKNLLLRETLDQNFWEEQ